MRPVAFGRGALAAVAVASMVSCGNDFDPVSKITSVRVLAARADRPYARPGDTVQLDLLAVDGRAEVEAGDEMRSWWVPVPCLNPPAGLASACLPLLAAALPQGVDLSSRLVEGTTFSFDVPTNAIADSPQAQSGTSYGEVFWFSITCAGRPELVGVNPDRPEASPFRCVDAAGRARGAEAFVLAFARVFVFAERENQNPKIEGLSVDGVAVDAGGTLTLDRCATPSGPREDPSCHTTRVDVRVPDESQESDPSNLDPSGVPRRESLWVDYYVTAGKVKNDVRIVFDPVSGRASSEDELEPPATTGEATLWAVLHDNRGGVDWARLSLSTR